MPDREQEQKAVVVAFELATQVELPQLRGKLADPTIEPGFLYRFGDAVWQQQARGLLERFVGGPVDELHDKFLFTFVRALETRLAGATEPP